MSKHPTRLATIARAGLLMLLFYPLHPAVALEVGIQERVCETSFTAFRDLDLTISRALKQVRAHRRDAEKSGEWYGREEFGPYIDALRDQEQKLRVEINDLRRMTCRPKNRTPSERNLE
jgi:hypothetical protein